MFTEKQQEQIKGVDLNSIKGFIQLKSGISVEWEEVDDTGTTFNVIAFYGREEIFNREVCLTDDAIDNVTVIVNETLEEILHDFTTTYDDTYTPIRMAHDVTDIMYITDSLIEFTGQDIVKSMSEQELVKYLEHFTNPTEVLYICERWAIYNGYDVPYMYISESSDSDERRIKCAQYYAVPTMPEDDGISRGGFILEYDIDVSLMDGIVVELSAYHKIREFRRMVNKTSFYPPIK